MDFYGDFFCRKLSQKTQNSPNLETNVSPLSDEVNFEVKLENQSIYHL